MADDFMSLGGSGNPDDDDLFAALSGSGAPSDADPFASLDTPAAADTDLFAALDMPSAGADIFGAPAPAARPAPVPEPPPISRPAPEAGDERPDWLRAIGGFEDIGEAAAPAPAAGRPVAAARPVAERPSGGFSLSALTGTGPKGMAFGMTARERMFLSILLFMEVSALSFFILVIIGAIGPR